MANVYKRGKVWYGRVTFKGQEYREPLDTASRSVAQDRLQEWVRRLKASRWGERPRRTFEETVRKFTAEHFPRLKPSSRERYLHSLLNLANYFQDKYLDEITRATLSAFESRRRRDRATNGSIRRDLACLSSVFRCAEEWEYHEGINPVAAFMRAATKRGLKEAPPRERYFSHEEETSILDAIGTRYAASKGRRDRNAWIVQEAAIAFAIDTGLRSEEQFGLTWQDIDLEGREVIVRAEHAKSGVSRRVPILQRTAALLASLPRHKSSIYVFWHRDGQRYFNMYQQLIRLSDKLGIKDVRWHDLRRTCGCRLLQDYGLPMEHVCLWLGHSSIKVTEKIYAFLDVRHLHKALAASQASAQLTAQMRLIALDKPQKLQKNQGEFDTGEDD